MSLLDSRGFSTANFFRHSLANNINAFAGRGIFCLQLSPLLVFPPPFSSVRSASGSMGAWWLLLLLGSMRTCLLDVAVNDVEDDEDDDDDDDSVSFFSVRTPISWNFVGSDCNSRTKRFPSAVKANNPPGARNDEGSRMLFFNWAVGNIGTENFF